MDPVDLKAILVVYEQIDVVPTVAVGIRVASQEHAVVLPRIRHGAFSFHFVYQQGIEDFLTPEGEIALRRHEVGAVDFGILLFRTAAGMFFASRLSP
jgi:hypothetical protein